MYKRNKDWQVDREMDGWMGSQTDRERERQCDI